MHPSTRYVLAGASVAAIIAVVNAQPAPPEPPVPPPLWLKKWLQDTPVAHPDHCPPETDPVPQAFTFNQNTFDWCLIDGPYKWDGKDWYVQRLKRIGKPPSPTNPTGGPWNDVIRVCSPQAVDHEGTMSPCGPAGPKGCKNCVINGVPQ
jgi:hypothetical protein